MKKLFLVLLFIVSCQINGQIKEITQIPHEYLLDEFEQEYLNTRYYENSISLKLLKDDKILFAFFYSKKGFTKCISFDNGVTWASIKLVHELEGANRPNIRYAFDVAVNNDGSYLIFAQPFENGIITRLGPLAVWKFSKNDELIFRTDLEKSRKNNFDLCRVSDQEYYLCYYDKEYSQTETASVIYHSIDGGKNWNFEKALSKTKSLSLEYSQADQKVKAVFSVDEEYNSEILFCYDILESNIISKSVVIQSSNSKFPNPKLLKTDDGNFWIIYNDITQHTQKYSHSDVVYITSEDNGNSWSEVRNFTSYTGSDNLVSVGKDSEFPLIGFIANRAPFQKDEFYFGNAGYSNDDKAPPFIYKVYDLEEVTKLTSYIARIKVFDNDEIASVFAENEINRIRLWDDGNHYDSLANDNIYGNIIPDIHSYYSGKASLVDVNNFTLPFNNKGVLADVNFGVHIKYSASNKEGNQNYIEAGHTTHGAYGRYLDKLIIFSAGFFLSGYKKNELFANAVSSSSLIEDYQAGPVGSNPKSPNNEIFTVRKDDQPFGNAWNEWKHAVDQGAYFYDGDGNGIYNPTDNNQNGIWEENEDRPDLLYDATYFTVYNDGVTKNIRRWDTVDPVGIEIRQTIFASGEIPELQDVIFIRYSILYKGLDNPSEPDTLKDVIFSIWNDADIGGTASAASDDLVGCDTTLQSGFVYNEGEDDHWGVAPPAVFRTILQGPMIKSNDQNDFAYNKMGLAIGEKDYAGWQNGEMASYRHYLGGVPGFSDANSAEQARNQMLGLTDYGEIPTPCNWSFSEVRGGADCSIINPYKWYSGDPVTDYGWICTDSQDQRDLINTGKFNLVKNEPMDIIVAYSVGLGTDALSSITDGRQKVKKVFEIYKNNFTGSYISPNYDELYPKEFSLSQNYPNPFNPTTTIEYNIPNVETGHAPSLRTKLIVYDILGRQIKTLVNEIKTPGSYEVTFDASQLASGVYFYRLTSGSFAQTKKMMVIK